MCVCPVGDPDHSQNLMKSKLQQDQSADFFQEDPTSSICVIWLTKKTNGHENNTSLMEVIISLIVKNKLCLSHTSDIENCC